MILKIAQGTIRFYQLVISPYLGGQCRHLPSCSSYTHEAISKYGLLVGTSLGVKRLWRCRPRGTYGYDPVP